jgi:hypothetical protein
MITTRNRQAALKEFSRAQSEAWNALESALLKLRMDMIAYPKMVNVEPLEIPRLPKCEEMTKETWDTYNTHQKQCGHCKAVSARYWLREDWRKGRGALLANVRYCLRAYRQARRNVWRAAK